MKYLVAKLLLAAAFLLFAMLAWGPLHELLTRPGLSVVNERLAVLASWKRAPGQIEIIQVFYPDSGPIRASVKYHYTVDGVDYSGSCWALDHCLYVSPWIFGENLLLQRIWPYWSEKGSVISETRQPAAAPSVGLERVVTYTSDVIVKVFYDPKDPKSAVLDNYDYEKMSYAGSNSKFHPIDWNDYYAAPLFCFVLFGGFALLFFILLVLPSSHAPHHDEVFVPRGVVTEYHDTQRTEYQLLPPRMSPMASLFGQFCLFVAFEVLYINVIKVDHPPLPDVVCSVLIAVLFGGLGFVAVCVRHATFVDRQNQQVVKEVRIWLLVCTWTLRRVWAFSEIECVRVKIAYVSSRGAVFHYCTISLVLKNSKKTLPVVNAMVPNSQIPADFKAHAEELARTVGVPCEII